MLCCIFLTLFFSILYFLPLLSENELVISLLADDISRTICLSFYSFLNVCFLYCPILEVIDLFGLYISIASNFSFWLKTTLLIFGVSGVFEIRSNSINFTCLFIVDWILYLNNGFFKLHGVGILNWGLIFLLKSIPKSSSSAKFSLSFSNSSSFC